MYDPPAGETLAARIARRDSVRRLLTEDADKYEAEIFQIIETWCDSVFYKICVALKDGTLSVGANELPPLLKEFGEQMMSQFQGHYSGETLYDLLVDYAKGYGIDL